MVAKLTYAERRVLESLFEMGGGYVLDFTDRTFEEFFDLEVGVSIYDDAYMKGSGSKANRLRGFWDAASDADLLRATSALVDYAKGSPEVDARLVEKADAIVARLRAAANDLDTEALQLAREAKNHAQLLREIEQSVGDGRPEAALDRLHSLAAGYLQHLCQCHGIATAKPNGDRKPLQSLMGEYCKFVQGSGQIAQPRVITALKRLNGVFENLNDARNHASLAHVNDLADGLTSRWLIRDVAEGLRKIDEVEQILSAPAAARPEEQPLWDDLLPPDEDDLPF